MELTENEITQALYALEYNQMSFESKDKTDVLQYLSDTGYLDIKIVSVASAGELAHLDRNNGTYLIINPNMYLQIKPKREFCYDERQKSVDNCDNCETLLTDSGIG